MPYEAPSAPAFKAAFPALAGTPDETVDAALGEAGARVDETWSEADWRSGLMLYAAHILASRQSGDDALLNNLRSVTIGPLSFTAGSASPAGEGGGCRPRRMGRRSWRSRG